MKKLIAVALFAVPFTFAAQAPATQPDAHADKPAKTAKKHSKKHKTAKTDEAAPATTPAPAAKK
jgi:hypothetical protein